MVVTHTSFILFLTHTHNNNNNNNNNVFQHTALPGDFGFDPLGLGKDPKALEYYASSELQHGRWAMLAVTGMAVPEMLTGMGAIDRPIWAEAAQDTDFWSWTTTGTLFVIQILAMHWAEGNRKADFETQGLSANYPGGRFDPLGYAKRSDLETLKVKEVMNGRLAMLATLGCYCQYGSTKVGPVANLAAHVADPWHNLVTTNKFAVPFI